MKRKYVSRKKKNTKMFLLLALLGITIGFAAVATTLKINGFLSINKKTWNIKWDRNSVVLSEEMEDGTALPTVSTSPSGMTDDTVSFGVDLYAPGDYLEFYIDAVNVGTINGEISLITTIWKQDEYTIEEIPDCLEYQIVYAETGEEPTTGDTLLAGERKTYKIRLGYKEDAELVDDDYQYKAQLSIIYKQGDQSLTLPSDGGPGIDKIANLMQDSPSTNAAETKNPVRIRKVAVENTGIESTEEGDDALYMGNEPNNFIYFNCDSLDNQNSTNCELWRIIGTDKDNGGRLKIIRDEPLEEQMAWNTDTTSDMTNNWENSTLKTYLNTTYYNSLSETSKKLVPTATWYTAGGYNVVRLNEKNSWFGDQWSAMTAAASYVNERTNFITDNPNFQRHNVQAKVGLMYASDYGYASATCYSNCTSTGAPPCAYADYCGVYNNSDHIEGMNHYHDATCKNSNWLYRNIKEWTMTSSMENDYNSTEGWSSEYKSSSYYNNGFDRWGKPIVSDSQFCLDPDRKRLPNSTLYPDKNNPAYKEDYHYVFYIEADTSNCVFDCRGTLLSDTANKTAYVRPAVYLKSKIDLEGTGSRQDPYKIIASDDVLNNEDVISSSSGSASEPSVSVQSSEQCADTKLPECTLNYVNPISNGFEYSYSCRDNTEVASLTSLFSTNPTGTDFASMSFDSIGTNKNGTEINGGVSKIYTGRWTTLSSNPPVSGEEYYFTYGAKDTCGNWVLYHSEDTYQY